MQAREGNWIPKCPMIQEPSIVHRESRAACSPEDERKRGSAGLVVRNRRLSSSSCYWHRQSFFSEGLPYTAKSLAHTSSNSLAKVNIVISMHYANDCPTLMLFLRLISRDEPGPCKAGRIARQWLQSPKQECKHFFFGEI